MEAIVQSSQQHAMTEDSSDRSESSTMSQEYQIRGFESYEIMKRLNLSIGDRSNVLDDQKSIGRVKDYRIAIENVETRKNNQDSEPQHHDETNGNWKDLTVTIGKSKEFGFEIDRTLNTSNNHAERSNDDDSTTMLESSSQYDRTKDFTIKDAFLQNRQKFANSNYDRSSKKFNYHVLRGDTKDYGLSKSYNVINDRHKDYNGPLERMREHFHTTVVPRERLGNIGCTMENSRIVDGANDHHRRDVHGRESRTSQELENLAYERMRRSQQHILNRLDYTAQNLVGNGLTHHRQSIVGNQMQQSQQQQQQQLQQQQQPLQTQQQRQPQIKSFTIDAILAHTNNQKGRHRSQQQQMRKTTRQECQEIVAKTTNALSPKSANVVCNGNGKAKRVRTIFTPEQLERLEGEFARQQYMVGPERLYLAHALCLTEAQVKVWFQNRRIKWRKVNHVQQCLAVNEHRQRCNLPDHETNDINEDDTSENNCSEWCGKSVIAVANNTIEDASDSCSQIVDNHDLRNSTSVVKP